MRIKNTLTRLGYKEAGVELIDAALNRVEDLLSGYEFNDRNIGAAFKYAVLEQVDSKVLGSIKFDPIDNGHFANWFWKKYPEDARFDEWYKNNIKD